MEKINIISIYNSDFGVKLLQNSKEFSYNIGDTVVYRKQGVYLVSGIKEQEIGGTIKDYYVLSSVYDKNSSVYVPVNNETLTTQMERVLSKEEIDGIIDESEENSAVWIEDNAQRSEFFEEILKNGNLSQILSMLKLLILRKGNPDRKTHRCTARDEKVFAAAMKAVTEAFAYPLGIEKTEVISYITDRVRGNK